MEYRVIIPAVILIFFVTLSFAQGQGGNTLKYDDADGSPKANLSVVSWLEGHWKGEAFGGIVEEIWAPAFGGSMMGAFKLVVDDKVEFYELETIMEIDETLVLRLKHFGNDLKGWEEKDVTVDFRLVKVSGKKVYFDGFTIEQISDNEIDMYVVVHNGEATSEEKFNYHRVMHRD